LRYGHDEKGGEVDARSLRLRSAMAMRRRVMVVAVKQEIRCDEPKTRR
jgi:hypothetical protein